MCSREPDRFRGTRRRYSGPARVGPCQRRGRERISSTSGPRHQRALFGVERSCVQPSRSSSEIGSFARLAERFSRRLVVVRGGPGFGKSTLLWQAIDENHLVPSGADRFWRCTADDLSPEGLVAALGVINDLDLPSDPMQAIGALAARIWAQAPQQVALILDDAHLLWPENQPHPVLTRLLDELPLNAHLVLATRTPPPLPLARLSAGNDLAAIDEAELCFTDAELDEFAAPAGHAGHRARPGMAGPGGALGQGGRGRVEFVWEQVLADCPEPRLQARRTVA